MMDYDVDKHERVVLGFAESRKYRNNNIAMVSQWIGF